MSETHYSAATIPCPECTRLATPSQPAWAETTYAMALTRLASAMFHDPNATEVFRHVSTEVAAAYGDACKLTGVGR